MYFCVCRQYPLARCKAYDTWVPCPADPIRYLSTFYEFGGKDTCVALPRRYNRDDGDERNKNKTAITLLDVDMIYNRSMVYREALAPLARKKMFLAIKTALIITATTSKSKKNLIEVLVELK